MKYLRNSSLWLVVLAIALCLGAKADDKVKVACIGNSITYGLTLDDHTRQSYPGVLQTLLGPGYEVGNFGHSGATLLHNGHNGYDKLPEWQAALDFCPDIAVMHLGINDTDPRNWPNYNAEFVRDYLSLISALRQVNPDVRIILANLTPLRATHRRFKSGTRDWRLEIRQAIADVAQAAGVELIDFDTPLRDRQDLLPDGIHPNAEGSALLAQTACNAITGDYGGLSMAPIYSSGMVLQRDRYLTISGNANAGAPIALTIAGRTYKTKADNTGRWSVKIVPLTAGTGYEMTVTDGRDTLRYTDIAAGEVWLASGQSNMAFMLHEAIDGEQAIAQASDPLLRFYDLKPIAYTNDVVWDAATIAEVNQLRYFKPAQWQGATPETVRDWSAIAYYYGRELRDSLQVPVGIICNAVGGATTESWIDINTLEMGLPEALLNWQSNDYTQRWAQGRAKKNTELGGPAARHPYEPTYLFSAGMRPLDSYPIAGVIWYQGESNAHNIEVHEQLFPLLVDSWRRCFGNESMPFYMVQLSSIDRPSWPQFRDSQRRMAQAMSHVGMAVSSDLGDSLDVHPKNKRPIGHRLARIALNDAYGRTGLEYSGPVLSRARTVGASVVLEMEHAHGMHSSDGVPLREFEIAEIDGLYYPAEAQIVDNQIILTNMHVKKPRWVRYGWNPFSRANLVNSDQLPASTFKAECENALTCAIEPGYDAGVSACFAGRVGEALVMAGGCNFPDDPLGASSPKVYYSGIYLIDAPDAGLVRIGNLTEPIAYGCSAQTSKGVVLIGGTTSTRALDRVQLLGIADGLAVLTDLPSLPATIDNAAACAIGDVVYVAGGNVNGQPSNSLYSLDLNNLNGGWQRLRSIPGNPRVQPVMAAARNAKGEECLYLWGGFAGKSDKRQATLEVDGLCYVPSTGKWSALPAPTDAEGNSISLGGGVACAVDGKIFTAGGVNKDVFLSALRSQPADYLVHPIEWYKFNPQITIYDPIAGTWAIDSEGADTARAGAAIIAAPDAVYIIGGELKPRIRTAQIARIIID